MIVGPIRPQKHCALTKNKKRTYSEIKSRSMHSRMPFPFASPCSLKREIRAGVTDDRFNVVRAGIKRQPSLAAALFRLHWCWCCCWCKKVPGRAAPAGEEEEAGPDLVSDRSQALAGLARAGARSNRRPCAPQRYTFLQCCAREILCYGAALFTFLPAV